MQYPHNTLQEAEEPIDANISKIFVLQVSLPEVVAMENDLYNDLQVEDKKIDEGYRCRWNTVEAGLLHLVRIWHCRRVAPACS